MYAEKNIYLIASWCFYHISLLWLFTTCIFVQIFSYYFSVSLVKISSAMTTINPTKCSDNFGIHIHKEYMDERFQDYH